MELTVEINAEDHLREVLQESNLDAKTIKGIMEDFSLWLQEDPSAWQIAAEHYLVDLCNEMVNEYLEGRPELDRR